MSSDVGALEVVILFVLILLNGVFAMGEIALIASRRAKLSVLSEEGDVRALKVLRVQEEPTRALSAIQVGITSVGILSGIVGEAAFAKPIAGWLVKTFALDATVSHWIGVAVIVILVTYFSIVFGELVPKRLGQVYPETVACRFVSGLKIFSFVMAPFVKMLSASTDCVLRFLNVKPETESGVTEEEIHAMIDEGSETGVIEENERDMVHNVFGLDDRQLGSVMTPRADIEWIDLSDPESVNVEKVIRSNRSRLIAAMGGLDDVRGYCTTRALLKQLIERKNPNISEALSPVTYVPETMTGLELLEHFKATDASLSLVVDEYGEIVGLVSPRDILETIAGEFKPDANEDFDAVKRKDGSWLLDGFIAVPELKDTLGIRELPEEESGRYDTLSGMMMLLLERMPKKGDTVTWDDWRLEVLSMEGLRIDKVVATRLKGEKNNDMA